KPPPGAAPGAWGAPASCAASGGMESAGSSTGRIRAARRRTFMAGSRDAVGSMAPRGSAGNWGWRNGLRLFRPARTSGGGASLDRMKRLSSPPSPGPTRESPKADFGPLLPRIHPPVLEAPAPAHGEQVVARGGRGVGGVEHVLGAQLGGAAQAIAGGELHAVHRVVPRHVGPRPVADAVEADAAVARRREQPRRELPLG